MNTSYIYSVSRVKALGERLLSRGDIDRLLVAEPGAALHTALKETYLAPYVLETVDEDMPQAIESSLIEARELLTRIAPEAQSLQVLWVQYDIHNLRVCAKATRTQATFADIEAYLLRRGAYDPRDLYERTQSESLDSLHSGWQAAYKKAVSHVQAGELHRVDAVFDRLYFATMQVLADQAPDPFVRRYVSVLVDIHNLQQAMRTIRLEGRVTLGEPIAGGSFDPQQMRSFEAVCELFSQLSQTHFAAALQSYRETGNTTQLDAAIDDYIITFVKEASVDMFGVASLVLYYLRVRQAATNVRTIVVGLENGQSMETVRANLRFAHVNN